MGRQKQHVIFGVIFTCGIFYKASGQNYVLTSSCDGSVQTGDSCTLSCDTRDTSQGVIVWRFGDSPISVAESTCNTSVPFPSDYSITCPSGSSTVFTVTLTNAQFQRDTVSWRCDYGFGGRGSNTVNITVEVPLTSVSLSRSSTSITCVATSSPRPFIILYRDGRNGTTSPPAAEGSAGWTATLMYSLSGDKDNSLYWCASSNGKTTVNSTASYPNISVSSVTLTNISKSNQEVGAAEGQQLTLTCVTSASYPAASVAWYKNNVLVTTGVSERSEVTSGVAMVTTGSLILPALSKSDHGQQVYCTATNAHTASPVQSNTAILDVWYGPEELNITVPSNTPAVENRDLTLTCEVTSHPEPTFTWSYTDGSSPGGSVDSVTSVPGSTSRWSQTLTFRPDRNRPGLRCEARNTRTAETRSTTRTLDVKYPPSGSPSITQFKSTMFEGDTGETISCSVSGGNPLADLSWTCPGTGSPSVGGSGLTRTSTLTFTVTRGQGGQECRCQGSWQYRGYDRSDVRTFNVSYPPSKPVVSFPAVLCEGQPASLSCSSSDRGHPDVTYTLTKNSSPVSPDFSPVSSDDGASVSCIARNLFTDRPSQTSPQSDPKSLTVHYAPIVQIPRPPTYKEGDMMSLTCVSHSKPSTISSNIRWKFEGREIDTGDTLVRSDLTRRDHGVYNCEATTNSRTCGSLSGDANVTVTVNYAPNVTFNGAEVKEGESVTLTCEAEGRPASYNFRPFTQFWENKEIKSRDGVDSSNTYTLRLDSTRFTDSGVYECGVDNSVTDQGGHLLVQRKRIEVTVKAKPKFTPDAPSTVGAEVGHNTTLNQTFYSRENCTFSWSFSGDSSGISNSSSLRSSQVTLDVYGKTVRDLGWVVSLKVVGFQEKSQGLYNVTVCNSLGCNSSTVQLKAAGPPLVPLNLHVINTTQTSIVVQWTRNFPGGDFTQVFELKYRKLGESEWKTVEVKDNTDGDVRLEVMELETGVKYNFKVRAVSNREGKNMSPFTDIITNQTLAKETKPSNLAVAVGAGAGVGAAALLVAVVVIVLLVLKKRRRNKTEREGNNSLRYQSHGRQDDLVMRDNVLYATSNDARSDELVMQENDLYAHSGPRPSTSASAPVNPSDVYAEVKPKTKAAQGNISAKPMMKNPGKNNERVKAKDNTKAKKKTKKDDKVPLEKKSRPNRGDVYENTTPGEFAENTYANTAFVHDEAATPEGAKSGMDEDGCMYVTVEFGNKRPGTVIQKEDPPTEYAGIAYGKVGPPLPPDEDEKKDTEKK